MERRMSPKGSCTVWSGGKDGDNIKVLPITIFNVSYRKINIRGTIIGNGSWEYKYNFEVVYTSS